MSEDYKHNKSLALVIFEMIFYAVMLAVILFWGLK